MAILVCRWKQIEFYEAGKVVEQSIVRLLESECTIGKGISHGILRQMWRGDAAQPDTANMPDAVESTRKDFESKLNLKRSRIQVDLTGDGGDDVEEYESTITHRYRQTSPQRHIREGKHRAH